MPCDTFQRRLVNLFLEILMKFRGSSIQYKENKCNETKYKILNRELDKSGYTQFETHFK